MDDDLLCEYDSTWDTESDGDELENTGRSKKTRPAFVSLCAGFILSLFLVPLCTVLSLSLWFLCALRCVCAGFLLSLSGSSVLCVCAGFYTLTVPGASRSSRFSAPSV